MFVFYSGTYREVMERYIQANRSTRGYKSRLAEAAGCHNSYISQVLKGSVDLTLEQALNLAAFWQFDAEQTDFFLDLLLLERAGNGRLRQFYERRLRRAREAYEPVSAKQAGAPAMSTETQVAYYASWFYAAVQALAVVREYASAERIASRLRLPATVVRETLHSLAEWGILHRDGGGWKEGNSMTHIVRTSPLGVTNQSNWRQRVLFNVQARDPEALHLQQVFTVRKSEIPILKARMVECLEEIRGVADKPDPDDAIAVVFDLFRL